jgi:hypothetical protein
LIGNEWGTYLPSEHLRNNTTENHEATTSKIGEAPDFTVTSAVSQKRIALIVNGFSKAY